MNKTQQLAGFEIHRIGFGTMRLVGEGAWGEPQDRDHAKQVLRAAAEEGVNFFDTADAYGPNIAEDLLREALHPYTGLLIATKGGITRQGPAKAAPCGRPEYLHQCVEMSLRRLGVERIDLYQLHRIDPQVPVEDSLGKLVDLQAQGKIAHIGLSEVSVEELTQAQKITPIASVQNRYNLSERKHQAVLDACTAQGIAFIPWYPVDAGKMKAPDGPYGDLARSKGITPTQLALAWLLHKSPVIAPIPGTYSLDHLRENVAAADVSLTDDEIDALELIADTQRS